MSNNVASPTSYKGGTNPPNTSNERPPAPQGSGGTPTDTLTRTAEDIQTLLGQTYQRDGEPRTINRITFGFQKGVRINIVVWSSGKGPTLRAVSTPYDDFMSWLEGAELI